MIGNIVCIITVIFTSGTVSMIEVSGKLLSSSDTNYLVDFSQEAKEKNYTNYDYSKVIVNKSNCVKFK